MPVFYEVLAAAVVAELFVLFLIVRLSRGWPASGLPG
jgi:hypothetical protein